MAESLPSQLHIDLMKWDEELPEDVRFGFEQDKAGEEAIFKAELARNDVLFKAMIAELRRLDAMPGKPVAHHSRPHREGWLYVALSPFVLTDKSFCQNSMVVTVNNVVRDDKGRTITAEDYFIDTVACRLAKSVGSMWLGNDEGLKLPPAMPNIIWGLGDGQRGFYHGSGYVPAYPDYDKVLGYGDILDDRESIERINEVLMLCSNETTRDYQV